MVHTRSPEGYLARLRSGAEYITVRRPERSIAAVP